MLSTSARLLRLASLLQSRRHWPGAALAEELGVDARTVRRDVDRLRELGYPVEASSGVGGGYALGRGADLPPLVLDDDEAVALAIALRAASASVGGIEATSLRLMGKLDQLMPTRLRRRATALHAVTLSLRSGPPLVDAALLSSLATACRDCVALRFGYRNHAGETSQRRVQPQRLANYGRRWYLIAWDSERSDWRSFRVDRLQGAPTAGAALCRARCRPTWRSAWSAASPTRPLPAASRCACAAPWMNCRLRCPCGAACWNPTPPPTACCAWAPTRPKACWPRC